MKTFLLFLCFFVVGFVGIIFTKKYMVAQKTAPIQSPLPKTTPFLLDIPPKDSEKGTLVSKTGSIEWQSRSATEASKLTEDVSVLQGEEFWTKENGRLTVLFPNTLRVTMSANTHINIVQTLPTNFAFLQDSGQILYEKLNTTTPLGVRVLHLLVQQENSGKMTILLNEDQSRVSIIAQKGPVTIAFNDTDNTSTVVTVDEGKTYTFDEPTRTGELTTTE